MRAWMFAALAICACNACKSSKNNGALDAASGPMGYPTYESQYCSRSYSETPLYTCSPDFPLVCLTTYQSLVQGDGGPPVPTTVYVCRLTCTPEMGCAGTDVCCPGMGINGQTVHGCTPANACDSMKDR